MEKGENNFVLYSDEGRMNVQRSYLGTQVLFRINFSDRRKPLILTRATHSQGHKFWTSVPEGRQQEAEKVGALISEYFKSVQ